MILLSCYFVYRRVLTHHAHEDSHWQHDSNTYKKCLKCFRKYFEIWQVHVFQNRRWATFMKHVWHWRGWYFQINLADQVSRENGIFCLKMCSKRNILWKVIVTGTDDLEWVSLQHQVGGWSRAGPWRRSRHKARSGWRSSTSSFSGSWLCRWCPDTAQDNSRKWPHFFLQEHLN